MVTVYNHNVFQSIRGNFRTHSVRFPLFIQCNFRNSPRHILPSYPPPLTYPFTKNVERTPHVGAYSTFKYLVVFLERRCRFYSEQYQKHVDFIPNNTEGNNLSIISSIIMDEVLFVGSNKHFLAL